jgi:hypothetical protein
MAGGVAQGVDPQLKPKYQKTKKVIVLSLCGQSSE